MPNCPDHGECFLTCSECGEYYCPPNGHPDRYWIHNVLVITTDKLMRGTEPSVLSETVKKMMRVLEEMP